MDVQELTKIAEGREAEIYAWQDGRVLRLLRWTDAGGKLEREASAMEAARAAGVNVPATYGTATASGRPGLIMDRVEGPDLLTLIGRKPWLVLSVGAATGRLQADLHEVKAPDGLPSLRDTMRRHIDESDLVPDDVRAFALEALEDAPEGDRICHGDFHPGNVIRTPAEDVIIDWPAVMRGDPMADYARTDLMMRLGEPPPGSPLVIRVGAHGLRGVLLGAYRRAYRRRRALDLESARRWEGPVAANRLTENIESERPSLLATLKRAMDGAKGS